MAAVRRDDYFIAGSAPYKRRNTFYFYFICFQISALITAGLSGFITEAESAAVPKAARHIYADNITAIKLENNPESSYIPMIIRPAGKAAYRNHEAQKTDRLPLPSSHLISIFVVAQAESYHPFQRNSDR